MGEGGGAAVVLWWAARLRPLPFQQVRCSFSRTGTSALLLPPRIPAGALQFFWRTGKSAHLLRGPRPLAPLRIRTGAETQFSDITGCAISRVLVMLVTGRRKPPSKEERDRPLPCDDSADHPPRSVNPHWVQEADIVPSESSLVRLFPLGFQPVVAYADIHHEGDAQGIDGLHL